MLEGCDMIVRLYDLPEVPRIEGIKIKRAFIGNKTAILQFIRETFSDGWACEAERSMLQDVSKVFIAEESGKVVGFACFDSTAKGFFGPVGVAPEMRGKRVGEALLISTLKGMLDYGYGYGIIGWVKDAEMFYRKTVDAEFIKNGEPEKNVYRNMLGV